MREGPHVIHLRIGNMKMRSLHGLLNRIWNEVSELSERHRLVQVYPGRIECIE